MVRARTRPGKLLTGQFYRVFVLGVGHWVIVPLFMITQEESLEFSKRTEF